MASTNDKMQLVRFSPDERIRFHAGAEIGGEMCLVGGLDILPRFEPYNRIFSYRPDREEPWVCTDVEAYIHSVRAGRLDPNGSNFFFLASTEGDFWALGKPGEGFTEIIPGAGDVYDGAKYGDVMGLNQVGQSLYAVGAECQVHRRTGPKGPWELVSQNILNDLFFVRGAAGIDPDDAYLFRVPNGRNPDYDPVDRKGQILHSSDGGDWRIVWDGAEPVSCGPCLLPNGEVVIGGLDGRLIQGDATKGFRQVARGESGVPGMVSLAAIGDELFAADGLLVRREGSRTVKVRTGLKPELESSIYLSSNGSSLLSVGYHDIVRLKDGVWERIHFPENSPVTETTDWSRW